jgi:hypothetical protein
MVEFGISTNMKFARIGRNQMKKSILTIAIALACVFGAQQASAKTHKHKTNTSMNKKHHKKNVKKTAATTPAAPTAVQAVS